MINNIESFENHMNQMWVKALTSDLIAGMAATQAFTDKRLVAIYLTQVYHYAVHTHRHQALVGVNPKNTNVKFLQYCFEHALEETGHELMALKDINSLGFELKEEDIPGRLPSTDLLISFMYKEARSDTPVHHLGYGFWSENACPYITTFMNNLMGAMGLSKNQLTFYTNHVTIDEGHAKEVRTIIDEVAKTQEDWNGMVRVAEMTFNLTLGIIKDTVEEYNKLISGESKMFEVFNQLELNEA